MLTAVQSNTSLLTLQLNHIWHSIQILLHLNWLSVKPAILMLEYSTQLWAKTFLPSLIKSKLMAPCSLTLSLNNFLQWKYYPALLFQRLFSPWHQLKVKEKNKSLTLSFLLMQLETTWQLVVRLPTNYRGLPLLISALNLQVKLSFTQLKLEMFQPSRRIIILLLILLIWKQIILCILLYLTLLV